MRCPAPGIDIWNSAATSGSRPIMRNSVVPMPNAPIASASRAKGKDLRSGYSIRFRLAVESELRTAVTACAKATATQRAVRRCFGVFIRVPCKRAQNRAGRYHAHFDRVTAEIQRKRSLKSSRNRAVSSLAMKIGIVGVGRVGAACALSLVTRGSAREIVIVDRTRARAKAVAADFRYAAPPCPERALRYGDYAELAGAGLVMLTAGVNGRSGGATDRGDPKGRLKLLETNAGIYRDVVPKVVAAAPGAVLLVVTDPPDPLADLARRLAAHDRVLSTGTLLDSLRLRVHLAARLGVDLVSVEAQGVGEHGTSEVLLWSSARVGGVPLAEDWPAGTSLEDLRSGVEHDVRYANIAIIEGNEASQFGIGIVSARIAEAVLRDERAVLPIGAYNADYGVTLSLPSVVGREGVSRILQPTMSDEERRSLAQSAEVLRQALQRITS